MSEANDHAAETVIPPASMSMDSTDSLLRNRVLDPPNRPGLLAMIDRFEILRLLRSGGMAVVFLARDPADGSHVAVKVLRPELAGNPRAVHRFLTEARHMQRMSHPNILAVLEVSDRAHGPYFTMPYMEKGSLADVIRPGVAIDQRTILALASDVAEAMSYAHARGITHRDLKPANVLIGHRGQAYLADFGLGRTVYNDSIIDPRSVMPEGTPAYLPPEVAAGKAGDTRCDIYSFGAMLYEMLTGAPPYDGSSAHEIMRKVLEGPPRPIIELNKSAPRGLMTIAEGAMARDLRDRYAEMSDVAADLDRVAKGHPPLGPHGKMIRRRRWLLAAAAAIVVLLGVGIGISLWKRGPRSVPPPPPPPLPPDEIPVKATEKDNTIVAYNFKDHLIWTWPSEGRIEGRIVGLSRVVKSGDDYLVFVGIDCPGDAKIVALSARRKGQPGWQQPMVGADPWLHAPPGPMKLLMMLSRSTDEDPQPVALSQDAAGHGRVTVFCRDGAEKGTYWHPGPLVGIRYYRSSGKATWLLAWGRDPDQKRCSLVMLDPDNVRVQIATTKPSRDLQPGLKWHSPCPENADVTNANVRISGRIKIPLSGGGEIELDENTGKVLKTTPAPPPAPTTAPVN